MTWYHRIYIFAINLTHKCFYMLACELMFCELILGLLDMAFFKHGTMVKPYLKYLDTYGISMFLDIVS